MRACVVEGCPRPSGVPGSARRLCRAHYCRWQKRRSLALPQKSLPARLLTCEYPLCPRPQRGRGFCHAHWKRLHKHGNVETCNRAPNWTPEEDARLLDLPTFPRSGMVIFGYLADEALHLGRTDSAARTRLFLLRKRDRGRRAQAPAAAIDVLAVEAAQHEPVYSFSTPPIHA